jgi:hypothetical protein
MLEKGEDVGMLKHNMEKAKNLPEVKDNRRNRKPSLQVTNVRTGTNIRLRHVLGDTGLKPPIKNMHMFDI